MINGNYYRKIDAMHLLYGTADGHCYDCPHFVEEHYHDRVLFKCAAYGITRSEASDWRKSWVCCGLKDLPLPHERRVIERIRYPKTHDEEQIEGQISIEEVLNGD